MNNDVSSPKCVGWHWWKSSPDAKAVEFNVTEIDLKKNKFGKYGGQWQRFPTYEEMELYKRSQHELYQRAKTNEENFRKAEGAVVAYHTFLTDMSKTFFTRKKKIKAFLEKMTQTSTQVPPSQ